MSEKKIDDPFIDGNCCIEPKQIMIKLNTIIPVIGDTKPFIDIVTTDNGKTHAFKQVEKSTVDIWVVKYIYELWDNVKCDIKCDIQTVGQTNSAHKCKGRTEIAEKQQYLIMHSQIGEHSEKCEICCEDFFYSEECKKIRVLLATLNNDLDNRFTLELSKSFDLCEKIPQAMKILKNFWWDTVKGPKKVLDLLKLQNKPEEEY